jgi:threonine synthase
MHMQYLSTRGGAEPVLFSEAVSQGLAPDGGLYLPVSFPDLSDQLDRWTTLSYPELCYEFFKYFATDLEDSDLRDAIFKAYSNFSHSEIAPLVPLSENWQVLELFHGPTLAFKDFALQLLGNFYELQIRRTGRELCVLGATSGDTGAAAISGLLGKSGVTVFILYPDGKVSPLQERQMTCTGADNVFPLAIEGTFDDAQKTVKELFGDLSFRESMGLSAVNSINLARILAQSVYYLYAWLRLSPKDREVTQFVVPTGNFGNVFAGWLLTKMGIQMGGFRVATNQNDVLHRLFDSGNYLLGDVSPSLAPSMDIQVASNFERLLFYFFEGNAVRVNEVMHKFRSEGRYSFEDFSIAGFSSSSTSDSEIPELIQKVWTEHQYLVDPHTACAFKNLSITDRAVILATAHPAKFPQVFEQAGLGKPTSPVLDALLDQSPQKYKISVDSGAVRSFIEKKLKPA